MAAIFQREWTTKAGLVKTGFCVTYFVRGKSRRKQFKTRKQAKAFSENLSVVIAKEEKVIELSDPIKIAVDKWLAACASGTCTNSGEPLEQMTLVQYEGLMRLHVLPLFPSVCVGQITPALCWEFRARLIEKAPTKSTAKKAFSIFKAFMSFCSIHYRWENNPASNVSITIDTRNKKKISIHSKSEMKKILNKLESLASSPRKDIMYSWRRNMIIVKFLLYTGLRISEVRGLSKEKLDLVSRRVTVVRRADRRGRIGSPKTKNAYRTIDIPSSLCDELKEFVATHDHDLVFSSRTGKPFDYKNFSNRVWTNIQRQAGVPHKGVHTLRHFYASRMLELGVNLKELATRVGHADQAFTLSTYGHLFSDEGAEKRSRELAEAAVL